MTLRWMLERLQNVERERLSLRSEHDQARRDASEAQAKLAARRPRASAWIGAGIGFALGALATCAAAVAWRLGSAAAAPLPLPLSYASGLALVDGRLMTADWMRRRAFLLDKTLETTPRSWPLADGLVSGLASGGDSLWSIDGDSNMILEHRPPDYAVVSSRTVDAKDPFGLAADRDALWVGDRDKGRILRLKRSSFEISATVPLAKPAALFKRGAELWALDDSGTLHVFGASDLAPLRVLDWSDYLPAGGRIAGLAVSGRSAWILLENPPSLVEVPARRGEREPWLRPQSWLKGEKKAAPSAATLKPSLFPNPHPNPPAPTGPSPLPLAREEVPAKAPSPPEGELARKAEGGTSSGTVEKREEFNFPAGGAGLGLAARERLATLLAELSAKDGRRLRITIHTTSAEPPRTARRRLEFVNLYLSGGVAGTEPKPEIVQDGSSAKPSLVIETLSP